MESRSGLSAVLSLAAFFLLAPFFAAGAEDQTTAGLHSLQDAATSATVLLSPSQADTSMFAALVRYATQTGLQHEASPRRRTKLHVDPRVFSSRARWHDGQYLREDAPDSLFEARAEVLRRLGVSRTNVVEDNHCGPAALLPDHTDWTPEQVRAHCEEKDDFISAIFGLPQATPDTSCVPNARDETGRGATSDKQVFSCRVVQAAELTDHTFFVYALYVGKEAGGGWTVVGKKSLGGVFGDRF